MWNVRLSCGERLGLHVDIRVPGIGLLVEAGHEDLLEVADARLELVVSLVEFLDGLSVVGARGDA